MGTQWLVGCGEEPGIEIFSGWYLMPDALSSLRHFCPSLETISLAMATSMDQGSFRLGSARNGTCRAVWNVPNPALH